jgi:hypothetical protein
MSNIMLGHIVHDGMSFLWFKIAPHFIFLIKGKLQIYEPPPCVLLETFQPDYHEIRYDHATGIPVLFRYDRNPWRAYKFAESVRPNIHMKQVENG